MTGVFVARPNEGRWAAHNFAAWFLRTAILAVPLPLSAVVGVIVGSAVPGNTPLDIASRVLAAGLASLVAFALTEWVARRLLPLAVLLRLSLVFPDHAPSRFGIALRSTSVRRLREWARSNQDRLGEQALAEKVLTLASALNFHDRRTRGHSERTRALADLMIDELGLTETEANEVRWGAFLHDVGKLLVPAATLNKPGVLSSAEWEQIRQHPAEGARLVHPLRPFIGSGVDAVASHHESYDGTGYPAGLRGDEIPLTARIVAVVDSFEVMTAVRSYKRPMTATAARKELVRQAGKQFDPRVVRAFVNMSLGRLHWALGFVAWAAELPFIGIVPRAAAQVGAAVGAGSSAVSTTTLASVASVSLGATLAVSPVAAPAAPGVAPSSQAPGVEASANLAASPSGTPLLTASASGTNGSVSIDVGSRGSSSSAVSGAVHGPGLQRTADAVTSSDKRAPVVTTMQTAVAGVVGTTLGSAHASSAAPGPSHPPPPAFPPSPPPPPATPPDPALPGPVTPPGPVAPPGPVTPTPPVPPLPPAPPPLVAPSSPPKPVPPVPPARGEPLDPTATPAAAAPIAPTASAPAPA